MVEDGLHLVLQPSGDETALRKVLIVDDSSFFRRILKECLHSRCPSLIVSEAKDREETLQMIRTFSPDLIFMDIRLPDGNGLELTRSIKEANNGVKVAIVSNYDEPEYLDAVFYYKADYFIPKDRLMSFLYGNLPLVSPFC